MGSDLPGRKTRAPSQLRATSLSGVGSVAGNLSALSTLGSIIGTLLTTFVLIPVLFVSVVMQVLGLSLIVVAIVSYVMFASAIGGVRKDDRMGLSVMVLMALLFAELWAVAPVQPHLADTDRLLRYEDSSYHEILVTEQVMEADGEGAIMLPERVWSVNPDKPWPVDVPRMLRFNENTESGIFPYRGKYTNAVHYTDLLHIPLLFVNDPPPKRILVVGGGGGIIPTQYHEMYGSTADVAELDLDTFDFEPHQRAVRESQHNHARRRVSLLESDCEQIENVLPLPVAKPQMRDLEDAVEA